MKPYGWGQGAAGITSLHRHSLAQPSKAEPECLSTVEQALALKPYGWGQGAAAITSLHHHTLAHLKKQSQISALALLSKPWPQNPTAGVRVPLPSLACITTIFWPTAKQHG